MNNSNNINKINNAEEKSSNINITNDEIKKIKEINNNHNNLILSTEYRLPLDFIDLSYDNNKEIIEKIIQKYLISISKSKKNKGFIKLSSKKSSEEYNTIIDFIEFDSKHKLRCEKYNQNCRYPKVVPYKDNIVKISSKNFINASWIHMPYPYYFIATQGPLSHTIEDFWTMCYDNKVSIIIMLCNLIENNVIKCANYWNISDLKNFEIKKLNKFVMKDKDIIIRDLELFNKEKKENRNIIHINLINWEDHKKLKKNDFNKIIELIKLIEKYKGKRNAVVHCSAGIGRTGTFICMYNLYHEIIQQIYNNKNYNFNKDTINFNIMNLVRKIKEMRIYSVENSEHYSSLYSFANYLLKNYNIKK